MAQADLRHIGPVSDYLFGAEIYRGIKEAVARYELPTERVAEFLDLIDAVVAGTIELVHMPEIVAEAFGIDAERARKVTCDIAGNCLLALERYLPSVKTQIEAWGGKIADFPEYRVPKEQFTVDQYAGRLTETHALTLSPQFIKRLGFLVKSYVEGVKSHDAILGFFQRPVAIGGLGLAADVAEKILADVSTQKDAIEFAEAVVAPEEAVSVAHVEPVMLPEIAPSHEVATTTPVVVGEMLREPAPPVPAEAPKPPVNKPEERHADGEEIAQHEKTIAKKGLGAENDVVLEAAVKTAVDAAAATLAVKRIAKKDFADMARLTIKGVRDPYQTRALLERDCGVAGEELVQLLEAIMLGLEEYHARPAEVVAPTPVPPPVAVVPIVTAEQRSLDTRFAAVAGKLPTERIDPVMPSARVSAARTKEEEVAAQTMAVDEEKLARAAAASKPEPAKAMLTVGSVPPPQVGEQKVMTDVQFRPKLVGPVEELGLMTPTEFRRLSSNPADAARKVDDVLTNLESTSYEDRIRGVQAWRKSPINLLYAQMAAEALQEGVALAEVASRRRNKGQESLSPAEMKAIASINARIQF